MALRYSEELIQRILATNDLVEIISSYTPLQKKGKNYKGICPFHQEKTPSFVVDAPKGLYHCFGCGAGGNLFSFLQAIEKISFPEAMEMAAQRAGISLPTTSNGEEEKRDGVRKKILDLQEQVTLFFQQNLFKAKIAQDYLINRGYHQGIREEFQLGYAPPAWDQLLKNFRQRGIPLSLLEESGLIISRSTGDGYYDRFRNRIIFPIHNIGGKVVGFGGRVLDNSNPKYLNSPETSTFQKGNLLYGLYQAKGVLRQRGEAIIVEGYTDVISAYQVGIEGVVASLGTALTSSQARLLKRFVSLVYIGYDADTAGTKATWRGLDILEGTGLKVLVLPLPIGSDPDDFIKEEGKEAFLSLKDRSLSLFDFKLQVILKEKNIYQTEEKVEASQEIFALLACINNRIRQEEYLKKAAVLLKTSFNSFQEDFHTFLRKKEFKKEKGKINLSSKLDLKKELLMGSEEKILMQLITKKASRDLIRKHMTPDDFFTTKGKELVRFLYQREDLLDGGPDGLVALLEQDDLRVFFTTLRLRGEREQTGDPLLSIRRLKEHKWMDKKNRIWEQIRDKKRDQDLKGLNTLLLSFCNLLAEEEQFEERRGSYAG